MESQCLWTRGQWISIEELIQKGRLSRLVVEDYPDPTPRLFLSYGTSCFDGIEVTMLPKHFQSVTVDNEVE